MHGPNPLHMFAVRGLASLAAPEKPAKGALAKLRTATLTTLAAAGLDTSHFLPQAKADFATSRHHMLIVWNDVAAGTLRLFAPPATLLDDTSLSALDLLHGQMVLDLDSIPIEDVDATARVMSLMSVGGDDAADVHARFIGPHLGRYADDFPAPTVEDFEELWGVLFKWYIGGNSHPPTDPVDAWLDRVYAFGVGWFPPVEKAARKKKPAAKKPAAKKTAAKKKAAKKPAKRK